MDNEKFMERMNAINENYSMGFINKFQATEQKIDLIRAFVNGFISEEDTEVHECIRSERGGMTRILGELFL